VDAERVGEHVVPAELCLDDPVEARLALSVDDLRAGAAVGLDDLAGLLPGDEVALLVTLEVG